MAILLATIATANASIVTLHTDLDAVLAELDAGQELVWTEDVTTTKEAQTIKGGPAGGVRRIVLWPDTRPEQAGYDAQALDSMRAVFGEGVLSSGDAV